MRVSVLFAARCVFQNGTPDAQALTGQKAGALLQVVCLRARRGKSMLVGQ